MEQGTKELAEFRGKLNGQQKSFETERIAWINDKKTLEDTILDLSTSEKQTESDRISREQELKELEERAKVWTVIHFLRFPELTILCRAQSRDIRKK